MEFADDASVRPLEALRARRATAADLGRLYADRGGAFAGVAAGICGEAAQDAVQDAFVRALTRVGTLRSRGALEAWVWKIVLNEARRRAAAQPVQEAPASGISGTSGDGDPRVAAVRAAIEGLPTRQREVVFLRYFADLDEAAIASALGIRRGTVAATLHRVHTRLRAAIHEGGVEP
jgi:DNA-directed RNA polymerase specialized sigma24 family protein